MRYMVLVKAVSPKTIPGGHNGHELAGFAPNDVLTRDAAIDWVKRLPGMHGRELEIEVHQVTQLPDLSAPASRPSNAREPMMMY
jgi:hypothetical protein